MDLWYKIQRYIVSLQTIEIAYNLRDSNKEKDMFWNCAVVNTGATNSCADYFYEGWSGTYYLATRDMDGDYVLSWITSTGIATTMLYLHQGDILDVSWNVIITGWSRYNHDPIWWTPTIYSRYLRFTPVSGYVNDTGLILQIESNVTYTKWGREHKVIFGKFDWWD